MESDRAHRAARHPGTCIGEDQAFTITDCRVLQRVEWGICRGCALASNSSDPLKPRLDFARQGAKVADTLQFIVRQLDMKMTFQFGKQVERLQAVNAKCLEKIAIGRKV